MMAALIPRLKAVGIPAAARKALAASTIDSYSLINTPSLVNCATFLYVRLFLSSKPPFLHLFFVAPLWCLKDKTLFAFSLYVTQRKFSTLLSNLFVLIWSTQGLFSGLGINVSAINLCMGIVLPFPSLKRVTI